MSGLMTSIQAGLVAREALLQAKKEHEAALGFLRRDKLDVFLKAIDRKIDQAARKGLRALTIEPEMIRAGSDDFVFLYEDIIQSLFNRGFRVDRDCGSKTMIFVYWKP